MTVHEVIDQFMKNWIYPRSMEDSVAIRSDLNTLCDIASKNSYAAGRRAGADEYRNAFFGIEK